MRTTFIIGGRHDLPGLLYGRIEYSSDFKAGDEFVFHNSLKSADWPNNTTHCDPGKLY